MFTVKSCGKRHAQCKECSPATALKMRAAHVGRSPTNLKHGHAPLRTLDGARESPTYLTWQAMLHRCRDKNFKHYGKRGIAVCARWREPHGQGFLNFLDDMGERPDGMTLDRYPDNDGNYEPGNCRWATPTEQANNRLRHCPGCQCERGAARGQDN